MTARIFNDPHGTSDKARQGLLDNRCERAHPKRHRTQKRAKRLSAAKRQRIKHVNAMRAVAVRRYQDAARDYWRGERDRHP